LGVCSIYKPPHIEGNYVLGLEKTSILEKKHDNKKSQLLQNKPMVLLKKKTWFFLLVSLLNSKALIMKNVYQNNTLNLLKYSLWKGACLFEELSKGFHSDSVIHHYGFLIHQVISLHFEWIHQSNEHGLVKVPTFGSNAWRWSIPHANLVNDSSNDHHPITNIMLSLTSSKKFNSIN
jgi:hypothetical protein